MAMGLRPHIDTSSSYDLALVIDDISNYLVYIQNNCTALSGLTQQVKEISQATSAPAKGKRCDIQVPPELSVSEGAYIEKHAYRLLFANCIASILWT